MTTGFIGLTCQTKRDSKFNVSLQSLNCLLYNLAFSAWAIAIFLIIAHYHAKLSCLTFLSEHFALRKEQFLPRS